MPVATTHMRLVFDTSKSKSTQQSLIFTSLELLSMFCGDVQSKQMELPAEKLLCHTQMRSSVYV